MSALFSKWRRTMTYRNRKCKKIFLLIVSLLLMSACAKVDVHKVKENLLTQAERKIELISTEKEAEDEKVPCISE